MKRQLVLLSGLLLSSACTPTSKITLSVPAGEPFEEIISYTPAKEESSMALEGAPSGLEIEFEEFSYNVVFYGTVDAGEYDFTIDFESVGDQPGVARERWKVFLTAR